MRFDASGAISAAMFPEDWPRYVVKMATGAGKTKVLSLLMAWSWFHRLYEEGSQLARNFLLVAPDIIMLDRLRADFDGLRIFFADPVLPDNGVAGRNWRDDFQLAVHLQDDVRLVRDTGNLFLTNIHRVYLGTVRQPSLDDDDLRDYFLAPFGDLPRGGATDSRTDLGELIPDIGELAVFNDEAHHIHDERMAWLGSIRDIHHRVLQEDRWLALQIDVTATPRHDNGAIFVQTASDYPLVEAIHQRIVKHPVLPDAASRERLREHPSALFHERWADYLALGVEEWRKSFDEHRRTGKKAVLFVMVDDTRNCDDVGAHPERTCPELQGAVLVIHTKKNGDIAKAATGKDKEELEHLRREANRIDGWDSPYKAIVSVLMLEEGWDVRNVTTIVGLRAYAAPANILPEQTLPTLSRRRSTRRPSRTAAAPASKTTSGCATCGHSAPRRASGCRRRARCSTASSASPVRAGSSCVSPRSSTRPKASRRSRKTTSRSASGSTTSRPTATSRPTRPTSWSRTREAMSGSSRPRAARRSTCRARWRASRCGAPTPPKRAGLSAGRRIASSTSTRSVSTATRRQAGPRR